MEKHQRASINCSWPSAGGEELCHPYNPQCGSCLHVIIATSTAQSLEISHSSVASRFRNRSSLFVNSFVNNFARWNFRTPVGALHPRVPRSRNLIRIPMVEIAVARDTCSACEASCFPTRLFRVNWMVSITFLDGNRPCRSADAAASGS